MLDKNPFTDSWSTLVYAVGLSVLGGLVRYLNISDKFRPLPFIRDLMTAGFCGLLMLWMCEWMNIQGPLMAIMIAASGLMGTRLLKEVETLARIRLGLEASSPLEDKARAEVESSSKNPGV